MCDPSTERKTLARVNAREPESLLLPGPEPGEAEAARPSGSFAAVLRRRWRILLAGFLVLGSTTTAFVWFHWQSEYEAVGTITVSPSIPRILFGDEETSMLPFYGAYVTTQMQMITNVSILKRALESPELSRLNWGAGLADPAGALGSRLKVDNPGNTELISVSADGRDPRELAPMVNAVLRAYMDRIREQDQNDDLAKLNLLYQKQANLESDLRTQHDQLYKLAGEHGTLSLNSQQDAAVAGIQPVQIEMKKAQAARIAAETHLRVLRERGPVALSAADIEQLRQDMTARDSEMLSILLARQNEEQKLLQISHQVGPDHRELRGARDRVEELRKMIADRQAAIDRAVVTAADARARLLHETELRQANEAYQEAAQREQALEAVVREDLADMTRMGRSAVQLQGLREKVEQTKQLYEAVLQRIQHLEVEKQRPARVTIASWATEPALPSKDRRPKLTILALAASACLSMIAAALVDTRDTRVRCEDDVRRSIGLNVLGTRTIPRGRAITNKDVISSVAEEIRGIRGCVLFAGKATDCRSLLITSPNPQEGKTRMAGDLAVALAESGRRVLLIDADNRKYDLSQQLGAANRPGLADLLADGRQPYEFVLPTSTPGLSFMPAGTRSERFSELLVRPGQIERLREIFQDFDLVVVDSPPVLLSNEPCIWARHLDSTLMVLRARHSAREDAMIAKEKLSRMGGRIMGAVLNGVETRSAYYHRYGYTD
jgi:capsular exopolysaccharide synthesis family protein